MSINDLDGGHRLEGENGRREYEEHLALSWKSGQLTMEEEGEGVVSSKRGEGRRRRRRRGRLRSVQSKQIGKRGGGGVGSR